MGDTVRPLLAMQESRRISIFVLGVLSIVCIAAFAANLELPLVRNGIVYARAAENVVAHHYDARPVVADSTLSYDKPIGFAWSAAPLVAMFGNHTGLRIASLVGALAFLIATWMFVRVFAPPALCDRQRALALVFATLGPLVVYQAWSAHPDAIFAALYMTACVLAQRIVERPTLGRVSLWSVVVVLAVLFKNYGMILLPSTGLYCLLHARQLWRAPDRKRGAALIAVAFVLVGAVIASGWTGLNPWMRFEGEGGGVGQYGRGNAWIASRGTLVQLAIALAVNLQLALVPLFLRRSLDRRLLAAVVSFPAPYVLGLMLFPTTFYNMRYFLPVFPFAALAAVIALQGVSIVAVRALAAGFALMAVVSIAVFNVEPVYARVERWVPRWEVNWIGVPLSLLDNLRMPLHREEAAWIDNLNRNVDPGGIVYIVDSVYYRDARHGVFERAGLIREDVETRYVRSRGFAPAEARYWVQGPLRDPTIMEKLGTVTDRGTGLYLVETESSADPTPR